ncbi:MAG: transcription-repair coupling factor [Desulfobacteraceae bacterium]
MKTWIEKGIRDLRVTGLSGSARAYFLASLLMDLERPCLIVLPNAKDAQRFYRELEFFLPEPYVDGGPEERRLYDFPIYDISPLRGVSPHRELVARRLQGLYSLTAGNSPIVVTSTEPSLLKVLPKAGMMRALEYLEVEQEVNREDLLQRFEANGYMRTSLVEERGDYAVRGGVIDVFPPLYTYPVRLEFWGDRLESIRHFESLSQRSTENLKESVFLPANEIIKENENVRRARSMGRLPTQIGDAGNFPGQEAWLNHYYAHLDTLFDYLSQESLLILMDTLQIEKEAENFTERFKRDAETCRQEAEEKERPFPDLEGVQVSTGEMQDRFERYQRIHFTELPIGKDTETCSSLQVKGNFRVDDDLELRLAGKGRVSMAPLAEKISKWQELGSRVVVVCRTEQQGSRLTEILNNYQVKVDEVVSRWTGIDAGRGLSICLGRLSKGFAWPELGLYVISEDEIFGPKRSLVRTKGRMGEGALSWTAFSQLRVGDLVVHQDHGIGRYGGLCKMEIEEKANDFVIIEYASNDRLYVPADRISILQKYIGADERDPKLDRLGGRSWDIAKKKAKKSIREIAKQLVEIYALRRYRKGYAFSRSDNDYREFEATFEHEETPDQIKAIEDVLDDMESEQPMDRLVCGDVGFGKTEVAIRASFKAVMDGKQVAILVPTTVLAEQHYETLVKRMEPYGIKVAVLSRFKTRAEQKEIIGKVRSGMIDILIGTHRILQKDVSFKDLALLIIDEEQRFGVRQKEAIKRYRALVDVLALTATPIPRTFQMSLLGIRDLSLIETPPADRLAIQTHLSPYDEEIVVRGVELELQRGGQVFFVHNRVQTINQMAHRLMELIPKAKIAVAHGQMKERELEETMIRFVQKEIDVLVCTTIVESGLDIASANTIIINGVDRFGLSQIYQLRGRVGRSDENAYAYLLLSGDAHLTRDAEKRLRALMDFSHLGAGIHLAMHDLKIRGGGNILGFSQSGHIAAIGYELYLKLIEQSVAELKGEVWHEEINPEINVDLPAYLPGNYVSDTDVRLNLYRRLSNLRDEWELKAMIEEMQDRFGPLPREASNLIQVMCVRLLLKEMGILRLDLTQGNLIFTFSSDTTMDPEALVQVVGSEPEKFQFLSERKLKVRLSTRPPLESLLEAQRTIRKLDVLAHR